MLREATPKERKMTQGLCPCIQEPFKECYIRSWDKHPFSATYFCTDRYDRCEIYREKGAKKDQ